MARKLRASLDEIRLPAQPPVEEEIERRRAADIRTALPLEALLDINRVALTVPDGFSIHPKLKGQLERRAKDFGGDGLVEWAHAELLAFGSLLREGVPIRLSGQDCQRGTFSQRHFVLHDAETGESVVPLAEAGKVRFEIYNSPLTETAVLGFEYGYGVGSDEGMVLWEAQFGDFVNVAQVVVDQFVAAGRSKWGQLARLILLLPHGFEGQGPEHSSARLERFLQLCAEDNMRVAYPTTPAQYFHLLRRQAYARPERPLVVMTPKSLLRLPAAASPVSELTGGAFRRVIPDPLAEEREEEVTRLLLCSGKVYYDLQASDRRAEAARLAVARLEELYPFPAASIRKLVARHPNLDEIVWVQEEPQNMGALSYIGPRLRAAVPRGIRLQHVSRPERASPAEGKGKDHEKEQGRIVREAVG